MSKNQEFYNEAVEWAASLGYEEHFRSADMSMITFQYKDLGESYPSLTCRISEQGKTCSLSNCLDFKLAELISNQLMFKHPDIKRFINVFVYYGKLAKYNNPFE